MQGFDWVAEKDAINSLTWEDSRLVAPPGWGVTLHPEVNAGTPHGAALDMAFLRSVCLGHEESGLRVDNWVETFGTLGHAHYESFWPLIEGALTTLTLPGNFGVEATGDGLESGRKTEAGELKIRPDHQTVSASYVYERTRDSMIRVAEDAGCWLIDV